jgi:hypothetical protein
MTPEAVVQAEAEPVGWILSPEVVGFVIARDGSFTATSLGEGLRGGVVPR